MFMKNLLPLGVIALFCSCEPKESDTPIPDPTISISNIAPFEGDVNANFSFKVTLSRATDKTVTVDFATMDGTAGAGTDYIAKTGTITFSPQTTEKSIEITIVGDTIKELDETFSVELSKPTNASIGTAIGSATIRNDDTYVFVPSDGYVTPDTYTGYTQLFQDEFNGTQIDTSIWGYNIGTGSGGWGNNELQYYTSRPENVYLNNGKLVIQAKKESYNGSAYTSARLLTQNKRTFTFGRVDIRAKLPVAKGLWPALWSLGSKITQTGWPACGEMDIMELVGTNPNQVHGTLHWGATPALHQSYGTFTRLATGDFSDKFHVFSMIWEADKVEILMDDISYYKMDRTRVGNAAYPFNEPIFLIMNVAVGGDWPGSPTAATTFPQQMLVDYVRVFKKI
jgi:hypothetical protein